MAEKRKSTKAVRGAQLRRYFKNILESEAALSEAVQDRVVDRMTLFISSARFRATPPEVHIPPVAQEPPRNQREPAGTDGDNQDTETLETFDPFAFSVVVVLQKEGEAGLMSRLNEIRDVANLKRLAREQRLSLPRSLLKDESVDGQTLRTALVEAGHKRIANRAAAAG